MKGLVFKNATNAFRRVRQRTQLNAASFQYFSGDPTTKTPTNKLYLHVGPSGDCWTGHSIFAAKHLQPDYVRSIAIPEDMDPPSLIALLEDDFNLAQQIYDNQVLPDDILERLEANKAT